MIKLQQVQYAIRGKTIVHPLSLEIADAGMTALVGPNGAGKSTLLKMLAGELKPSGGTIQLDGVPMAQFNPRKLACRRAIVHQSCEVTFPLEVRRVVQLGRMAHPGRGDSAADVDIAEQALQAAGVDNLASRAVTTLSGGERQRVLIARALAQVWEWPARFPACLLMDEPVSSLDLSHQHSILTLARKWAQRGAAVVVVLHDLSLAMRYADHVLVLDQGHRVTEGSPRDALSATVLERIFKLQARWVEEPLGSGRFWLHAEPETT